MKYKYIFFDLDGTLWDSREGITKGVQYALSKMGIEEPDLKKLERFIGPPLSLSRSFMDLRWMRQDRELFITGSILTSMVFIRISCFRE